MSEISASPFKLPPEQEAIRDKCFHPSGTFVEFTIEDDLSQQYIHPRKEMEQSLVEIWEEVLNTHPVGVHDNLFDLGGHSLAATRVVSQVIKQFEVDIPLISLSESPTIAAMAVVIMEHQVRKLENVEIENILEELDSMSDEEAREMVAKEASKG